MLESIAQWLERTGIEAGMASPLARVALAFAALFLAVTQYYVAKYMIAHVFTRFARRTESQIDDFMLNRRVLNYGAHLLPAIVILIAVPVVFSGYETVAHVTRVVLYLYMIILGLLMTTSFLDALHDLYQTRPAASEVPIKGFVEVIKIAFVFISIILAMSLLINQTPLYLFSGLGAMTAVLLLIFKDSILGFVAGIQLTSNRMVAIGDWIEMPRYGADGDIIDVSLMTVKVRNWDKTITSLPTYALVSESFKNWRGMKEAGGRRIKRAINIDVNTIRFCNAEMIERYGKIRYISEYIERKIADIAEHNDKQKIDRDDLVNGRHMTNIGTFRAYVESYLRNHPMVHKDLTFLIRQLQPTEHGLPIEIYIFTATTEWAAYEAVQADIFDHIIAVLPAFDLRAYQQPSGYDIRDALSSTKMSS